MARPRTVSDEEMLSAARAVFLEHGGGASTKAIAERLGVSQAALFKRFGTKKDLMIAALAPPAVPPFVPILEGGPDPDRPMDEQLGELARVMASFFTEMVPCVMVLNTSGMDPRAILEAHDVPPPVRAQRAVAAWVRQAIDLGLARDCDPDAVAFAVLGVLHLRAFFSTLTRQPPTEAELTAHVERAIDVLWRGIAPQETDR